MNTVPDLRLGPGDRFPFVTVVLATVMAGLTVAGVVGWPRPEIAWSAGHGLVIVLLASAAVEYALGPAVYLLALMITGLISAGLPLLLTGEEPDLATWLPLAVNAMLGLNLGLFLGLSTRPLYFLGGPMGKLRTHWALLLVVWAGLEAVWWGVIDPQTPLVIRLQCVAGGLLIGVSMNALSLIRPSMINPEFIENRLEQGLSQARDLIDDHRLKKARRLLAQLGGMAPDNLELKQLRYAAWKYDPAHAEFHKAAGALLDQGGKGRCIDYCNISHDPPPCPPSGSRTARRPVP